MSSKAKQNKMPGDIESRIAGIEGREVNVTVITGHSILSVIRKASFFHRLGVIGSNGCKANLISMIIVGPIRLWSVRQINT